MNAGKYTRTFPCTKKKPRLARKTTGLFIRFTGKQEARGECTSRVKRVERGEQKQGQIFLWLDPLCCVSANWLWDVGSGMFFYVTPDRVRRVTRRSDGYKLSAGLLY